MSHLPDTEKGGREDVRKNCGGRVTRYGYGYGGDGKRMGKAGALAAGDKRSGVKTRRDPGD